jgi:HEAT repeats
MRFEDDSRTAEELFQIAFQGDPGDEEVQDAIRFLRIRNTEEIFQLAVRYSQSAEPRERARALDVLAQLGTGRPRSERPHLDESIAIAIERLRDNDPMVVNSAAWALSHIGDDLAVTELISMRNNLNPDVRWAVANGLNGSERPDAIATLIELMDDSNDNVRDWATFALGTQCPMDSPEIRDALRSRLGDSYEDANAEAVWGLARRKDEQGLRILIERLGDRDHGRGDEMAACEILGLKYDVPAEELRERLLPLLSD